MDPVHQRQSVGRLNEAERELPGDAAHVLALPVDADVALEAFLAMYANGGQVVERDRQLLVEKRTETRGEFLLHAFGVFLQSVHRARQAPMGHLLRRDARHGNLPQPSQDSQLAERVAKPVECHDPDQLLGVELASAGPQRAAQAIVEAQFAPEPVEGEKRPRSVASS